MFTKLTLGNAHTSLFEFVLAVGWFLWGVASVAAAVLGSVWQGRPLNYSPVSLATLIEVLS